MRLGPAKYVHCSSLCAYLDFVPESRLGIEVPSIGRSRLGPNGLAFPSSQRPSRAGQGTQPADVTSEILETGAIACSTVDAMLDRLAVIAASRSQ
jgi:hypothetical protein